MTSGRSWFVIKLGDVLEIVFVRGVAVVRCILVSGFAIAR